MTYADIILILQNEMPGCGNRLTYTEEERYEAYSEAIDAILQLQKYKRLGTVDDIQELVNKSTAQNVIYENRHGEGYDYKHVDYFICPCCGRRLRNKQKDPYCGKCGQHIKYEREDM